MKKIMYFAAALLVLVGCQKSQEAKENAPANYGTITGKIELPQGPNKIAAPEGWEEAETAFTMVWESTDKIYIYNQSDCKELTVKSIDEQKSIATFEGELLTDMSSYNVAYGYDPRATSTEFAVPYIAGNYRPFATGEGTDYTFTIAHFEPVIGLQLKGTDALTKIEVVLSNSSKETLATYTMTFAEALALNASTAIDVYFTIQANADAAEMAISFYKNESSADVLIMTKTTTNIPEEGKVTTFPELTVAEPFVPTYVDLGLSVKWATCNVGATKPEEYGDYFAWGETRPKTTYADDWSNYFDTNDGGLTFIKYYKDGGLTTLEPEDDAAHVNWDGNWRMPTKAELEELKNNCTWNWTQKNGINGYEVEGTNGNTIFLPASGDGSLPYSVGFEGYYRSSSLFEYNSSSADYLVFSSGNRDWGEFGRYRGLSVRPVCQ